jgi:hypothetical protein
MILASWTYPCVGALEIGYPTWARTNPSGCRCVGDLIPALVFTKSIFYTVIRWRDVKCMRCFISIGPPNYFCSVLTTILDVPHSHYSFYQVVAACLLGEFILIFIVL